MNLFTRVIHRLEDSILVALLLAMILLAGFDILARTVFGGGVSWIPPLLRVLVLWLGLLGALVATRSREHIAIDLINRLAPPKVKRLIGILTSIFAASVCLLIAWHSGIFVKFTREFEDVAFSGIPAWPLQAIIPVSFGLAGLRFSFQALEDLFSLNKKEADSAC